MKFEALILLLLMLSVHRGNGAHRRILHQPLYPESSFPPPTPPLPPPEDSDGNNSDQPFFPEDPYGGTQYQTPPPPLINGSMPISTTATHPTKPTQRAAIAISIGIVTLGFLSILLFFIYRKKVKNRVEEQKPETVMNPNSQSNGNGSRAPPSNFLYIGTVEPHNQRSENFSSVKKQGLYRPSPDLMPLPPLIRLPPGNATLTSSEDEGLDEIKHAIIPSIKKTPPPQEAPRMQPLPPEKKNGSVFELKSSLPRRAKFGPPPPPPNLALLQSISSQTHHTPKVSATTSQPPPPLPPPPPLHDASKSEKRTPGGEHVKQISSLHWCIKGTMVERSFYSKLQVFSTSVDEFLLWH